MMVYIFGILVIVTLGSVIEERWPAAPTFGIVGALCFIVGTLYERSHRRESR